MVIVGTQGSIDYQEKGIGPTIVMVPGSCSTGAAWHKVVSRLSDRFRCVTTSLLGYGETLERRTIEDSSISHEVEALASVVRKACGPVHLVGHSFGGLVAIALAIRNEAHLVSLTVVEAPASELLRESGEFQYHNDFRQMSDSFITAYRGGDKQAIAAMIDFYGGARTYDSWPAAARAYAIETTPVNILDWESAYGFPLSPQLLASIDVPTLVLRGQSSHQAVKRANELISECIERASLTTIDSAAHFMITTHANDVAEAIAHHVSQVEIAGPCDNLSAGVSDTEIMRRPT